MTHSRKNSADTKPLDGATLHIITHLQWEREGERTFDQQRAELLDTLAHLVQYMQDDTDNSPPLRHFLPGGQTILLDDIASVRSNLLTALVEYNTGGRLGIGPWYIQTDGMLAGGESLVRNLLLGQADAAVERHLGQADAVNGYARAVRRVLDRQARQFEPDAGGSARDDGKLRHQIVSVPGFRTTFVQSFWL